MKPELPPRSIYWIQDGETLRPPTDEEFVAYLQNVMRIEGVVLFDEEGNVLDSPPAAG